MKTLAEKQVFTYDDITRLPEGNYEIIDGERRETIPAGFEHGYLVGNFAELLGKYLKDKGNIAIGEIGILISKNPLWIRAADKELLS